MRLLRTLRLGLIALGAAAAAGVVSVPAQATYFEGQQLRQRSPDEREYLRVWRRSAWIYDDFFAQSALGKFYNEGEQQGARSRDRVEALVWYYLASLNYFSAPFQARRSMSSFTAWLDAVEQRYKIERLLSPDEVNQARARLIYILSCRGALGYLMLGSLHEIQFERSNRPSRRFADEYGVDLTPMRQRWSQGGREGPPAPPGTTSAPAAPAAAPAQPGRSAGPEALDQFVFDSFRRGRQAENISNLDDYLDRRAWPTIFDSQSLAGALTFYLLAEREGVPEGRARYDDLVAALEGRYGMPPDQVRELKEKVTIAVARWMKPFELYPWNPDLDYAYYSDECYHSYWDEAALGTASELKPRHLQRILRQLGFYAGPIDNAMGPGFRQAVARYQKAQGVDESGVLSPAETVRMIRIAAIRGFSDAENILGVMYAKGVGLQKDFVRAEYWFLRAAQKRYGPALHHLGTLYAMGGPGVPPDKDKATRFHNEAKLAGFDLADIELVAPPLPPEPKP